LPEAEIARRYHLALVALFTLPGIPQLYYGNELGLYGGSDPDNRRDMPAWAWTAAGRSQTHAGEALPTPEATFRHVRTLIAIRKENPALFRGSYAEMWRHNGDPRPNVYAFFRGDGDNRIVTVLNNGALPSGDVTIPVRDNGGIPSADRAALADGTVLVDLLQAGAPSARTLSDGHLTVNLAGKSAAIYRARSPAGGSALTFRVEADTVFGQDLYVSGSTAELGGWEPRQAVRMRPSGCTGTRCVWSVTLRYLPPGQSMSFKFLKRRGVDTIWEGGADRSFVAPASAIARYDGQRWHD
jgi:hypothetical protein